MSRASILLSLSLLACGSGDDEHTHSATDAELQALQETVDALTAELTAATAAIDAQNTAIEGLESEIAALNGGVNLSDLDAAVGAAETRLDALEADAVTKTYVDTQDDALRALIDANTAANATQDSRSAANTSALSTQAADIATNLSAIEANNTSIAANSAAIGTHTTDIAANAAAITALQSTVSDHGSALTSLQSTVGEHTTAIAANTTTLDSHTTQIGANSTAIAANAGDIATSETAIAANGAAIATNAAGIDANAAAVEGVSGDLEGATIKTPATTCLDLILADATLTDGVYWLTGTSGEPYQAWCDMTTQGGGWTLLGTIFGGGSDLWDDEDGFWASRQTLGSPTAPYADHKSAAWHDLDISASQILFERRYDGDLMAQTRIGNACLTDSGSGSSADSFDDLFADWNDFQTPCPISELTTVTPAIDATGLSSASYQEGSGSDALGGTGTNGFCWNGGDNASNTFQGHVGWNQSGYPNDCYAAGHLGYIGVFNSPTSSAQYGIRDIDGTNWLNGTDLTRTSISLYAR